MQKKNVFFLLVMGVFFVLFYVQKKNGFFLLVMGVFFVLFYVQKKRFFSPGHGSFFDAAVSFSSGCVAVLEFL